MILFPQNNILFPQHSPEYIILFPLYHSVPSIYYIVPTTYYLVLSIYYFGVRLSVRPSLTFHSKIFSSETTRSIGNKLRHNGPWIIHFKNCVRPVRVRSLSQLESNLLTIVLGLSPFKIMSGKSFGQIFGIQIETKLALLIADLFLYYHYMQAFNGLFNNYCRYLNKILKVNNPNFLRLN